MNDTALIDNRPWVAALATAIPLQALGVWFAKAEPALTEVFTLQAYLVAGTALVFLSKEAHSGRYPDQPLSIRDWALGGKQLFVNEGFRSLTPTALILLSSVAVLVIGDFVLRPPASGPADAMGIVFRFIVYMTPIVRWGVTALLVALALLFVRGESDLRFVAALAGYAYAPLPVVYALLFAHRISFVPDTVAATDPQMLVPAVTAGRAVDLWAIITIARGLHAVTDSEKRPYPAYLSLVTAALPFVAISGVRLTTVFIRG